MYSMAEELREEIEALKRRVDKLEGKDPEGELTDWAKKQLAKARATPDSEYIELK